MMSDLPVQPPVQRDNAQPPQQAQPPMPVDSAVPADSTPTAVATPVLQAAQSYDPLNPPHVGGKPGRGVKELVSSALDARNEIPGVQVVETEQSAEIPPEVESWMEKVDHREVVPPKEIVVADQTSMQPTGHYAAQPVIVLPTSQQTVKKGMTQGVTESIRWLAEWCFRVIKKFHGMVVYREEVREPQS